jgi:hypothetical protein
MDLRQASFGSIKWIESFEREEKTVRWKRQGILAVWLTVARSLGVHGSQRQQHTRVNGLIGELR